MISLSVRYRCHNQIINKVGGKEGHPWFHLKKQNILGTTCRTFGNRCLRYWLLHLKNENARDPTVTSKTNTIMRLVKQVALVRCWPQFLSVCLQRFQNKKHFLVYTLRKSETLKEKCTHFKQGQQVSCGVIVMVMAWFVMGTDDGWREGGVRCEDDVSGQLAAAVKSPFESTWGSVGMPLRTRLLPSPLLSTPGCTWREIKSGALGHLIDCDTSNWFCGSFVNDWEIASFQEQSPVWTIELFVLFVCFFKIYIKYAFFFFFNLIIF